MSAHPLPSPPTFPSLRDAIPHVFIFPPEEEQVANPPWCCFNASEDPIPEYDDDDDECPSDSQYIDVALDFIRDTDDAPIYRRTSLDEAREVPRKGEKRSGVLTFINYRNDGEGRGPRELPEDIVEVIKVRRNEGKVDASTAIMNPVTQRSRMIKLPFQKAFRSIKNVAKSSSSRKPHAKSIWSSSQSNSNVASKEPSIQQQEEIKPPVLSSPLLIRQPSRRLSQLFGRSNRSNVNLISTIASEPDPAPEPAPAPPPKSPPSPVISTAQSSSLPYLRNTDTSPSVDDLSASISTDAHTHQAERPTSPSLSKRSSRRLSAVDLHRLFTFSTSSIGEDHDSSPRPSQDVVPTLLPLVASNDTTSTTSSTSSHKYLPIDFSPTFGSVDTNVTSKAQWRAAEVQRQHRAEPAGVPRDIDVEMRLDSLHFDSLSFDPEDFDVSLEMDGNQRL